MNNPASEIIDYITSVMQDNPRNLSDVSSFHTVQDKISFRKHVVIGAFMENPELINNISFYWDNELCLKLKVALNSIKSVTYPYDERDKIVSVLFELANHYQLELDRSIVNIEKVSDGKRGRIAVTVLMQPVIVP